MKKAKQPHNLYFIIWLSLMILSCIGQNKTAMKNKTEDRSTSNGRYIISAPIVYKNFVKKNGKATEQKEIYLQRSIQDYYIKFCESKISREQLENHLSSIASEIKTAKLEVEFREGYLESCEEKDLQSRQGQYVIIHRIIKDK